LKGNIRFAEDEKDVNETLELNEGALPALNVPALNMKNQL